MEPIITLNNIGVRYRTRKKFFRHEYHDALKDISFEVYRGETLGVVGHNGAGKSTLLKVLAGIYTPDSGVYISKAKKTSLLALQVGFDTNLSGRDNAVISGLIMGFKKKEILSRIENIKEYSELDDYFELPIKTYSTGMRARLGFSVAAQLKPEVLLLDEVLGVGDQSFKNKSVKTIKELMASDSTVILVSHSKEFVNEVCQRSIELKQGHCSNVNLIE